MTRFHSGMIDGRPNKLEVTRMNYTTLLSRAILKHGMVTCYCCQNRGIGEMVCCKWQYIVTTQTWIHKCQN